MKHCRSCLIYYIINDDDDDHNNNINLSLPEGEGHTEEYWPKVVEVRTDRSSEGKGPVFPSTARVS